MCCGSWGHKQTWPRDGTAAKAGEIKSPVSRISDMWEKSSCALTVSCLGSGVGFSPTPETRRGYHPLAKQEHTPLITSRNAEPLWSLSVSLLHWCPLHRVSPHLFSWTPVSTSGSRLSGRTVVGTAGGKICMLTARQAVRCGQDTDHCHFIIYRRVCTVSGAQLLSGVRLFATLWTVACQAPLSVEFSRRNIGVGCCFLLQGIFLTQEWNPHLLNW